MNCPQKPSLPPLPPFQQNLRTGFPRLKIYYLQAYRNISTSTGPEAAGFQLRATTFDFTGVSGNYNFAISYSPGSAASDIGFDRLYLAAAQEPSSSLLLGGGLMAALMRRKRQRA